MCVICAKPVGVKLPDDSTFHTMWTSNPDGAGIMYTQNGKVVIDKGYMTWNDFDKRLQELKEKLDTTKTPMVFHFRIGTHGGNIAANTHPFPISDSIKMLQKLRCDTAIGVAHNGIIPIEPRQKDISDTMEYIASQLAPLYRYDKTFYKKQDLMLMIENAIHSKMAFLTANGEIYTIGAFINENGVLYSNSSYCSYGMYRTSTMHVWPAAYDYDDVYPYVGSYDKDTLPVRINWCPMGSYLVDNETGSYISAHDYNICMDTERDLYFYDIDSGVAYPIALGDYEVYDAATANMLAYDASKAQIVPVDYGFEVTLDELTSWDDVEEDDNGAKGLF